MTATAVASAMRIRTAPPFVGRVAARQALLGVGGLRPVHSRPERRAGRHRPFWLVAAGCAAGCVQPLRLVLGVVLASRVRPPGSGRAETSVWSDDRTDRRPLPECRPALGHGMHPKGRSDFAAGTVAGGRRIRVRGAKSTSDLGFYERHLVIPITNPLVRGPIYLNGKIRICEISGEMRVTRANGSSPKESGPEPAGHRSDPRCVGSRPETGPAKEDHRCHRASPPPTATATRWRA